MEEKVSKEIAYKLLNATTSEQVSGILNSDEYSYYFSTPENWANYGNREKNWDTAGNQQSNGVGALVENIVNGLDAVLLRKAEEAGITDPRSPEAPQSMQEAVRRFFNVPEGKLRNLSKQEISELVKQSVKIGVTRGRKGTAYPTYTVIDEGIGQKPEDFPKTFLSLSEKNKEGIKFVQGKFNQGSTGVLRFCTRGELRLGHYKLIISKRYDNKFWGWTIVRVREPKGVEVFPVVEYFKPGRIPSFRENAIQPFFDYEGVNISSGSIVKLYEVDISSPFHTVDFGIYQALATSLIAPPLPIQSLDFGAAKDEKKGGLRAQGIAARVSSGLYEMLNIHPTKPQDEEISEGSTDLTGAPEGFNHHVQTINDDQLGIVKITATAVPKLQDFIVKQPKRLFYTINGQTHGTERASWLNVACQLGDIQNNIVVNVDCTELTNSAISQIFMTDRERVAENSLSSRLRELTRDALRGDDVLRQFMHDMRIWRARKQIDENKEAKEILESMVKTDPTLRELFGIGKDVLVPVDKPAGTKNIVVRNFPLSSSP
jgi:hypothetical protein